MWESVDIIPIPTLDEPTERGMRPSCRLLPVIVLANLPNSHQSLQVLIGLVRVDVVQGTAVPGVPI